MTDPRDPDDLSDLSQPAAGGGERWWWDLRHQRAVRDDDFSFNFLSSLSFFNSAIVELCWAK